MIQSERRQKIYELVQKNGYITYDKISAEMGVTDRTIRRDVNELSEQGLLCKVWGGVKSVDSKISLESDFQIRTEQNSLLKQKIGEKAASLIEEGECIGIDIGTTALEVAKSLNSKDITVVTSSIPAIIELMSKPEINVICTGGKLSRNDKCFNGQYATTVLDEIILDKVFIGVAGMSFDYGFSLFNSEDAIVKKKMISHSLEVIILMDSSKIGHTKHALLCGFDRVDKIIIDSNADKAVISQLRSNGIEVIVV